ncbi:Uncharacterised protein [Bordetella ansorpii]|uniref:Lipoprotein n=1 Tax=Bordetella ansorpii TaxID=288768 RepID=A0A157P158_9BORD|nr:hypothetical protein [Bordetella ansorpii]SAI27201.1 Uncharacterised protein [Bordetella ansorpii]
MPYPSRPCLALALACLPWMAAHAAAAPPRLAIDPDNKECLERGVMAEMGMTARQSGRSQQEWEDYVAKNTTKIPPPFAQNLIEISRTAYASSPVFDSPESRQSAIDQFIVKIYNECLAQRPQSR